MTWHLVRGLPSLRTRLLAGVVGRTIRAITEAHRDRRSSFRILHFSIQPDHLHLIVEAGLAEPVPGGRVQLWSLVRWLGEPAPKPLF